MVNLTEREKNIGRLVALGYSNREAAHELGMTEQAVKSALHAIFNKLGVWNRVELAARFLKDELPALVEESGLRIEAERMAELQRLQILDSVAEQMFDDVTAHLISFFEVPVALVGLVDSNRLWFKSNKGMEVSELPRELTICHHTIQKSDVYSMSDIKESQFACNPLVRQFGVRFYAAAPILTSDGYALGVVCIVDYKPRQFSPAQLSLLSSYAKMASRQMELRREMNALRQSQMEMSAADPAQIVTELDNGIRTIAKSA